MSIKRLLSAALSLILTSTVIVSSIPGETIAATNETKAEARYVYDGKKRTGIESIKIDDVNYYDIVQGKGTMSPESGNYMEFYKQVLTGEPSYTFTDPLCPGQSNSLNHWAELAEKIFQCNEDYTADINAKGNFEKNFGKGWNVAGYTDVSKALSSLSSSSNGGEHDDYTKVSGLSYANSLSSVRQKASDTIVDMIGNNSIVKKYSGNSNLLFDNTDGDNSMKALKDDNQQDVFYTMVNCVDNEGSTYAYHYNSFVLAFYDFQLVPLAGTGLQYISGAEGYDTIKEASDANVKDVYYDSNNSEKVSAYYTNDTKEANTVTMNFDSSHSESVSNTFSNSKSYSYSEMIGYSVVFEGELFGFDSSSTFSTSFTTGQVISTAYSDTKTQTDSTSMSVTDSLSLPAHTAVAIKNSSGNTDTSISYQCPVAVTYKVAMSTLSGEVYADRAKTLHFQTSGYPHKTFSTTFGCNSSKGGETARENLYKRAVENKSVSGFEESYGNTYGYRSSTDKITALDWGYILDGDVTIYTDRSGYYVYYCEVDSTGKETGKVLLTSDFKIGDRGYEATETAPQEYTYSLLETDEDGTEKTVSEDYTLYRGAVLSEDEKSLDNTFVGDTNSKSLVLDFGIKIPSPKIYFYYQKKEESKTDSSSNPTNSSSETLERNLGASNSESETTNSPISNSTLTSMIAWMSTHNPMSSSGGKISYTSESKSTSVGAIVPLYPLDKILISNNSSFGDYVISANGSDQYIGQYYDANDLMDLTIYSGDKFLTKNVDLTGLDSDDVEYYGFKQKYGYWQAVKLNEEGRWVPDTSTDVAELKEDATNGNQYVLAGDKEGTYYIQYYINDEQYQSKNQEVYATNDTVTRPVIKLNIKKSPFKGSISLSKTFTGCVDTDKVDLNQELSVFVSDENGKRVTDQDIFWEAEDVKGISLSPDGKVTFSKAGSYQVRVGSENVYSNWVTIEAKEVPVLSKITFTAPDFKKSEVTLTDSQKSLLYDLSSYLNYYDQYGNTWTGDVPEIEFSIDSNPGGSINGNILTVSREDTYKIYASADGYTIDPISIHVSDGRKVGEISITGDLTMVVGDTASLDKALEVSIKDATGKEIEKPYTWDVQELRGINVSANGLITAVKSGTYHVRVVNEAGQYSAWHAITVKNPAITISQNSMKLVVGTKGSLIAQITTEEAQNKNITWASSNANVASVSANGLVTAKSSGSTVITARNAYGQEVTCTVQVSNPISIANVKKSGKKILLSWTKVANASGYEIYGNHCSGKVKLICSVPASQLSLKMKKINGKSLSRKNNCYKFYVRAYQLVGDQKVYLAKTLSVHLCYQKLKKYDNATKVTLNDNASLQVGESLSLKSKIKLPKGKKQLTHIATVRYISSNPNVASVNSKGLVSAKASGSCKIYAIAVNGKSSSISIQVK